MSVLHPTRVFLAVALLALGFPIAEAASKRQPAKIYEGRIGPYPVAVLLAELPDGNIEGYYYYTKRSPVSLLIISGARKGATLRLKEYPPSDQSQGQMSGRFEVNIRGHKVEGKWLGTSGEKEHKVALEETRTEKRRSELRNTILDAYDRLQLPSTGCDEPSTEEPSTEEPDEHGCDPMHCGLTYDLKNEDVRSVSIISSTNCADGYLDAEGQHGHFVYDAKTLRGIHLEEEIDPKRKASFKTFVRREGRKLLDAWRRQTSDEDWYSVFGGGDAEPVGRGSSAEAATARRKYVDEHYARLDPVEILTEFYVEMDGVHLGRCGLWNFPRVAAALDFCDYLVIRHQQIARYLKPRSVLKKLTQ